MFCYLIGNSARTAPYHPPYFCECFYWNKYKIDFSFDQRVGDSQKAFLLLNDYYFEFDFNIRRMSVSMTSNEVKGEQNFRDNYRIAFGSTHNTVGFIDVRLDFYFDHVDSY